MGVQSERAVYKLKIFPHKLKSDDIFIPCVELAPLYPLAQMVPCNLVSIWPQNGREDGKQDEERKLQGEHERRDSVSLLTSYLHLDVHGKD